MAISKIEPASLQYQAGTGPAFSVSKSGTNQSITSSTWTKVTFNSEEFDTNNNIASSTFTPTVAGYYQFNTSLYLASSVAGTNHYASFYKNGVLVHYGQGVVITTTTTVSTGSALIYLNGSTDYVEVYAFDSGTSPVIVAGSTLTYFQGSLVRAA